MEQKEPGALLGKAPNKLFWRWGSNPSNFSTETCLKQRKSSMLMAKSPFWCGHKFLRSKNKMADGCHSDIKFSINNINWVCTPIRLFVQNFKQIGPLWKIGNYDVMTAILEFFQKNENSIKSLRTFICTYILNFLTKLEFWRETCFTHNRHFENCRTSNLKREVLQAKQNLSVKTIPMFLPFLVLEE